MKTLFIFTVASVIIFPCCEQPAKKTSINSDTLATVYAELLVLNERYSLSKDSLNADQYQTDYTEILRKHDYTRDRFASELRSVAESPAVFKRLCDQTMARFQEMRRKPSPKNTQGRP